MAIRTFSQIVQSFQDNIRLRQPALDTKPGTVSRDLFIDNPADQISAVYRNIQSIQKTQSLLNATGQILDQFGSNYGIPRDNGHNATGAAILTFSSIINNIIIQSGTNLTAKTGVVFKITANITISAAAIGIYSSYASSIASQLHIAGISDTYAVQVPIEAVNIGANGNIPVYSLISTTISGVSNVTNIAPTSGGSNAQSDSAYRNQILAGLTGSAAGTSRGYTTALLAVDGIQSVYVASAGSPILTRDGTVVERQSDGSLIVITPGSGGDVDIWLQGSDLINITESYIFHDLSGSGDIASTLNAHILGQSSTSNTALTSLERRQLFTQTGELPLQPIDSIISLSGSTSGANFVNGVNYKLVKDTNPDTQNTAFALDNIVFIQDFISIVGENEAKGDINAIDALSFVGVKSVENVHQPIIITNDLAILHSADHTQILIPHVPLDTILRVTNLTTGERYVITDQGLDTKAGLNETGVVTISGSVLPSNQDLIQVDYTWDVTYDPTTDYFTPPFVSNGIDWGHSNYISMEEPLLIRNGNRYNLGISREVDRVFSAFYCDRQTTSAQQAQLSVQTGAINALTQITISTGSGPVVYFVAPGIDLVTAGVGAGDIVHITGDTSGTSRNGTYAVAAVIDSTTFQIKAVTPSLIAESGNANLEIRTPDNVTVIIASTAIVGLVTTAESIGDITNVISVRSQVTGLELFATGLGGTFSGNIIYLATDVEQPALGESVTAYFNSHEIFNIVMNNGTISGKNVVLSTDDILNFNSVQQPLDDIFNGVSVKPIFVNYAATDIDVLARSSIQLAPFIGSTTSSILLDHNNNPTTSRQPTEFNLGMIIRNGPAYLGFTVDGAFSSGGSFAIKGNGWFELTTVLNISQSNTGGIIDLSSLIAAELGTISTSYAVAKVIKIVIADANNISSPLTLRGYGLNSNTYDYSNATVSSINATSIDLSPIFAQNGITQLTLGNSISLTFYVTAQNISETIQFTTGRGSLYTKYKYLYVSRIDRISGFLNPNTSIITGNIRITRLSQPITNSAYLADYSYLAPTEGERLTIVYGYNNIIQDATVAIEKVRTLTADVLTRLAVSIVINVSATLIITPTVINQSSQIIDQATSAINNLIVSQTLGATLDYSALLRVITAISGVSGADIIVFDYVGSSFNGNANRKFITADQNQSFSVGTISVISGSR